MIDEAPVATQALPHPDLCLDANFNVSEREAIESAFGTMEPLFRNAQGPISALWVVSPDLGGQTAVRFWADARSKGLGLANPESFPWCLANAACGALARQFQIRGPNTTILGGDEAVSSAITSADSGLISGRFTTAFVVDIRVGSVAGQPSGLRVWCRQRSTTAASSGQTSAQGAVCAGSQ